MPPLRYLSHADVLECALTPPEVAEAVREAFLARARGGVLTTPTLHLRQPERSFAAKAALLSAQGVAAVKWYGNVPGNAARGLADYNPLVLLNDVDTGLALAVMDGAWLTAARTAALSAVAAGVLARRDAARLGIVGCGRQGAANFEALRHHYPLREVTLYSRSRSSAERLAQTVRAHGIATRVVDTARDAVTEQDIVVSAISRDAAPNSFLRSEWVRKGGFVSAVDMGLAWASETFSGFDFLASDEVDPQTRRSPERLNFQGSFDADLATLLAHPAVAGPQEKGRLAFVFAGSGLADAAVAAEVHRRAAERNIGTLLTR